jgi:multiple sugar transport system ATP-binding protein
MSVALSFEHVGKRYGSTVVLSDVTFATEPGELVVLVGPSGCGKSTLMRMVAGLETITEGKLRAGDRVLNDVPPHERGVGMVFQSYALYPHLTVRENLAFPLWVKKASEEEQAREVERVAQILSLGPLLDRLPKQLSGGQRQRVAIGRCLVRKPDIYCFDEPLSNLDAALRSQIRVELKTLQRELKRTTIYVTHDQVEAMTMADRIVVLHRGVVQQVGTPEELYLRPKNRFVARFIGTPSMTLVAGSVASGVFTSGELSAPLEVRDGPVLLGVRPEDVLVHGEGAMSALVRTVEPVGEAGYLHLEVPRLRIDLAAIDALASAMETPRAPLLCASIPGRDAFGFREGSKVRFDLRVERLQAFDPESGEALVVGSSTRAR